MEEVPRSRSEGREGAPRQAILDTAFALLRTSGYASVTVDTIARSAGVGEETILRFWSSKADVVLEAIAEHASLVPAIETGSLERDLEAFLGASFRLLRGPLGTGVVLRGLMSEAQLDGDFATRFAKFVDGRRAILRMIAQRHLDAPPSEIETLVDMLFGALWYRLLVGTAPVDAAFARSLAKLGARAFR
jgi:AcrR family transcriptional regulator